MSLRAVLSLLLAACTPTATPDAGTDAPRQDGGSVDVPADAPRVDASVDVSSCLGPSLPLALVGGTPYVDVRIGAATGKFLVDYGTTFTTFDPSALSPSPAMSGGCWPEAELFDVWSCPTLVTSSYGPIPAPFLQAGILGTDVLALHPFTLDLAASRIHRGEADFCTDATLVAAGFRSLEVVGWGDARRPGGVLVPAITVAIGGARAPAQIDTGFADTVTPRSINVNQRFFDAAVAAGARLTRRAELDLTLTTCVGIAEPVEAYALEEPLTFVATDGGAARSFDGVTVFLKRTPAAASACGGIGTWSEPGAQLGASFLSGARAIFDPEGGRVWID